MIVLDTNVISEIMTPRPNEVVLNWLAAQPSASVFTTATTQAEILYGIRILPEGKRRNDLEAEAQAIFLEDMAGQVLPFDMEAADVYADIAAKSRSIGRPMSQFDAQIAAIALSRGASVATRNVSDFADIELDVINPWDYHV